MQRNGLIWKNVGQLIWVMGLAANIVSVLSIISLGRDVSIYGTIFFSGAITIWSALLLYNWLFGNQKGHILHFILILFYFIFSVIFLIHNKFMVFGINVVLCVSVFVVFLSLFAFIFFKKSIYKDYQDGIKRDHFNKSSTRFK